MGLQPLLQRRHPFALTGDSFFIDSKTILAASQGIAGQGQAQQMVRESFCVRVSRGMEYRLVWRHWERFFEIPRRLAEAETFNDGVASGAMKTYKKTAVKIRAPRGFEISGSIFEDFDPGLKAGAIYLSPLTGLWIGLLAQETINHHRPAFSWWIPGRACGLCRRAR